MCPLSISLPSHPAFHPSIQTFIKWLQHNLFLTARKTEFKEYVLSMFVIFRKTCLFGKGPGPHGAVFIPDHNFTTHVFFWLRFGSLTFSVSSSSFISKFEITGSPLQSSSNLAQQ